MLKPFYCSNDEWSIPDIQISTINFVFKRKGVMKMLMLMKTLKISSMYLKKWIFLWNDSILPRGGGLYKSKALITFCFVICWGFNWSLPSFLAFFFSVQLWICVQLKFLWAFLSKMRYCQFCIVLNIDFREWKYLLRLCCSKRKTKPNGFTEINGKNHCN